MADRRYPQQRDLFFGTESTFGTVPSTASYQLTESFGDTLTASGDTVQIDPDYQRGDMQHDANLSGNESCALTVDLPIRGGTDTNAIAAPADMNPQYDAPIGACLTATAGTSEGLAIGGSSTLMNTDGGVDPSVGEIVCIDYTGSIPAATRDYRQVKSVVAGTSFTLYHAASGTPTASGVSYAGTNLTPADELSQSCSANVNSIVIGTKSIVDQYNGLQGTMTYKGAAGEDVGAIMTFSFDFMGDNWIRIDNTAPAITVANGAVTLPTQANPIQYKASTLWLNQEEIDHASFKLECGIVFNENVDGSQANSRGSFTITDRIPIIRFTVPDDDQKTFDPWALYAANTIFPVMHHAGTFPNSCAAAAQYCQIMEAPAPNDLNGQRYLDIVCKVLRPTETTSPEFCITLFGDQT